MRAGAITRTLGAMVAVWAICALPIQAKPMAVGDCWGIGLRSKLGRDLLRRSNVTYVQILARVEYMEGDIDKAFTNPRHRPWPWFDPTYRESIDSVIRKAIGLGLQVELNLDPGWTAVSPEFRRRLETGKRTPDEGSAWLFPDATSGYTDHQITLYADLFARAAAHCEKTYPGVVRWIQVGNDLGFPSDNYRKLVEAVVIEAKKRGLDTAVVADALRGRLARELPSGRLPDIVGFHHLPGYARPGSRYPSQAEVILELRRSLSGKRSWRGRPVEIWVDKWNPCLKDESMRSSDVAARVVDRLAEQRRLGVTGSGFITFFLDVRHTNPTGTWALAWNDGVVSPAFKRIADWIHDAASDGMPAASASPPRPAGLVPTQAMAGLRSTYQ
jgi:hypothetical protein